MVFWDIFERSKKMFWINKNYPFWLKGLAGWPDGMGWQAGRVGGRVGEWVGVWASGWASGWASEWACGHVGGRAPFYEVRINRLQRGPPEARPQSGRRLGGGRAPW